MSDDDVMKASDIFGISVGDMNEITEHVTDVMISDDGTVTDLLEWADTFSGKKRDFAIFASGKASCLNDLRCVPINVMTLLLAEL